MKHLVDCKEEIHSCSKCGLCQSVCPIYKITGNDCTVSKGQFIMLKGVINGDLKMSKTINKYLDLCLKCSACSKFCPSGIDVVDIVALAKAEYFKNSFSEKFISKLQKFFVFGFVLNFLSFLRPKTKSKKFEKKVLYFGGCGAKAIGCKSVVKILNSAGIEVVMPKFDCCGLPFFVKGDMDSFREYMDKFYKIAAEYDTNEIVTNCASCEKIIKSYTKWGGENKYKIRNIFEYLRENNVNFELKKEYSVGYHKPCNLNNYDDVKYLIKNIKNLNYKEIDNYDECCGLNGITKFSEYPVLLKLFKLKRDSIINSGVKTVLTSCLGCKTTLNLMSFGKYKTEDFIDFLAKNTK